MNKPADEFFEELAQLLDRYNVEITAGEAPSGYAYSHGLPQLEVYQPAQFLDDTQGFDIVFDNEMSAETIKNKSYKYEKR